VVLAAFSLVGTCTAGRDPRQEKLAPRAVDAKRAVNAVVRLSDLTPDWKGGVVNSSGDGDMPSCPWQDYSAFTITGQAVSTFRQEGSLLNSYAQAFPTVGEARQISPSRQSPAEPSAKARDTRALAHP
jgi:hypothetical protein